MQKKDLKPAGVTFRTEGHTYTRDADGKSLQGVTTMIGQLLYPDEYAHIDPAVLAAKAAYGTRRHREIQDMIVFGDEPETPAQAAFSSMMEEAGLKPIASEYTVTDGCDFASNIDVLCSDGSIVDIKTVASLNRQKVSWQLSLYALFFELTNPGLKAGRLFAAWIPKSGAPRLVEVFRRPEEQLRALMKAWIEGTPFSLESRLDTSHIERCAELKLQMKALEEEYNRHAAAIMEEMKTKGETGYSDEYCTVSYVAPSTRKTFDARSFQTADPQMYANYLKESATKETLRFTLRQ